MASTSRASSGMPASCAPPPVRTAPAGSRLAARPEAVAEAARAYLRVLRGLLGLGFASALLPAEH